jgi:hypothetical protein
MPITPDLPFPKSAGDAIRSKDWNDLVTETQRLDNAKVNRAGDAIAGNLTVAGSLGVKTTTPKAPLHVVGPALVSSGDGYAVPNNYMASGSLTIGSTTASFGGGNNWNANTAGLLLETLDNTEIAVHDSGTRLASVMQYQSAANSLTIGRDMGWGAISNLILNGNVGIGVPAPTLKVDVGDRIRLRQGPSGTAGLWLYQTTPAEDRAFIGMSNDNTVGFWGNKGANWSLSMDVTTGNVGVKTSPLSNVGLYINGGTNTYGTYIYGGASYALYVAGRATDQKIRTYAYTTNAVNTTSTGYTDMPNMQLSFYAPVGAYYQILVLVNGVQITGANPAGGYCRLVVDGNVWDATRHEFHNNGWELRGFSLGRVAYLSAGTHNISVQWATTGGTITCCWYGDGRQIQVIEL